MNKPNENIKTALLSLVNHGEIGSCDYVIAKYLLDNYRHIKDINIIDMAENCYVDRSTIRRFFKKYGFDNFLDFKKSFKDEYESTYFEESFGDYNQYITNLNKNIISIMTGYNLTIDRTGEIEKINSRIHDAENVYIFGDESVYSNMYFIQQRLLTLGKVTIAKDGTNIEECIKHIKPGDCILLISLSGIHYQRIKHLLDQTHCDKILVTIKRDNKMLNDFYHISQLASDIDCNNIDMYRKYALTYYLDIMLNSYKFKYSK